MLTFSGSRQEHVGTTMLPVQHVQTQLKWAEYPTSFLQVVQDNGNESHVLSKISRDHHHEIDEAYSSIAVAHSLLLTKKQAARYHLYQTLPKVKNV